MNYERTMKQAVISTEAVPERSRRQSRENSIKTKPDFYLILKQKQPE